MSLHLFVAGRGALRNSHCSPYGSGVLLLYSWMSDAAHWLPQSQADRVRIALRDLGEVYRGEVNVSKEFLAAHHDVAWSLTWATGDAMFYPGQFRRLLHVARQPERQMYFAGEHLSVHHTWIVGALDAALFACQQLLGEPHLAFLRPTRYGQSLPAKGLVTAGTP